MTAPKIIIFIGPQGSGKGTQAKILADEIHGHYIGTGALFREMAQADTEFGRKLKENLDKGILSSDEDVQHILAEKLSSLDLEAEPAILDGVPRNLAQAEFLVKYLEGKEITAKEISTIHLDLPREEAVERIGSRRVCAKCETPTVLMAGDTDKDLGTAPKCQVCGGELIQRSDDTPESVNRRLETYFKETLPVVEFLKKNSDFHEINGSKAIPEIAEQIAKIFNITNSEE